MTRKCHWQCLGENILGKCPFVKHTDICDTTSSSDHPSLEVSGWNNGILEGCMSSLILEPPWGAWRQHLGQVTPKHSPSWRRKWGWISFAGESLFPCFELSLLGDEQHIASDCTDLSKGVRGLICFQSSWENTISAQSKHLHGKQEFREVIGCAETEFISTAKACWHREGATTGGHGGNLESSSV